MEGNGCFVLSPMEFEEHVEKKEVESRGRFHEKEKVRYACLYLDENIE